MSAPTLSITTTKKPKHSFYLHDPPSTPRSESPTPAAKPEFNPILPESDGPGTLPDDVYDAALSWWRAGARRFLVRNLKTESRWLASMQETVRTPWLDTYFVYTSSLGTHTFFMTVLPAFFFFGYHEMGRGLLNVLATGVYLASLIKDLICSPRPFAPPVTRLTMGSHHLEYGFPSTHSTNSVSIALYIYSLLPAAPWPYIWPARILLGWYVFSIVFGRLYCAMHSFTDCIAGILLGSAIASVQWMYGAAFENWMGTNGWQVPMAVIPLCLILVHKHAEPVDDCPCFEDAIAFVSVVMGSILSKWHAANFGLDTAHGFYTSRTPGWDGHEWNDWGMWLLFASVKMVVGVLAIFGWRLVAKPTLHILLPPIFRTLARAFTLPHRRFYTPATDYSTVPPEKGLHPVPSVIGLGSRGQVGGEGTALLPRYTGGMKMRSRGLAAFADMEREKDAVGMGMVDVVIKEKEDSARNVTPQIVSVEPVKHYDADVLTKVIVYCGIGWLACEWLPVMFEVLEWGVMSGPVSSI